MIKRFSDKRQSYRARMGKRRTPEDRSDFANRLILARKHAKLTQTQLAKKAGLSQSTVAEAEGVAQGSASVVQLARACRVRPEWLALGELPMLPEDQKGTKPQAPPNGSLSDRLREEQNGDPYEAIERALKALIIVGKAKDDIMERVRGYAEMAVETQRALSERMKTRTGGK